MARERITLDVFEFRDLFLSFLGSHGSLEVGFEYVDDELAARLFAVFASNYDKGPTCFSPLRDLEFIRELIQEAEGKVEDWNNGAPFPGMSRERLCEILVRWNNLPAMIFNSPSESNIASVRTYLDRIRDHYKSEEYYQNRRQASLAIISSPKLRTLIMERDGAKCRWCGETDGLALDHILPVVAGGTDDPENLQVLCGSCNSSKGDQVPSQFKEAT